MVLKTSLKTGLFIAFLIFSFQDLAAQASTTSGGDAFYKLSYGLGVERRLGDLQYIHGLDSIWDPTRNEVSSFNHNFSLGYFKQLKTWLNAGLHASYGFASYSYTPQVSVTRTYENKNIRIEPFGSYIYNKWNLSAQIEIDLLWKNPNDAFLILFGATASYYVRTDIYEERFQNSSEVFNGVQYRRSGDVFRPFIGLEWEEYLGEHWGYRIGVMGFPNYFFEPRRLTISNEIRRTKSFPEHSYSRGSSILGNQYNERLLHLMAQAQFSLVYRL